MSQLPVRIARWSARHAWRAIAGWFAFVVLCLGIGIAVGSHEATTEDYRVGEAGRAEAIAGSAGMQQQPTEQVIIHARSGPLDTAAAASAAQDLTERMRKLPEVQGVAAPVSSKDGQVVRVPGAALQRGWSEPVELAPTTLDDFTEVFRAGAAG